MLVHTRKIAGMDRRFIIDHRRPDSGDKMWSLSGDEATLCVLGLASESRRIADIGLPM